MSSEKPTMPLEIEYLAAISFATGYVAQPEIFPLFCVYMEAQTEKAGKARELEEGEQREIRERMKAAGKWADQKIKAYLASRN